MTHIHTQDVEMNLPPSLHPRVVVVGAGFAGIQLVKNLKKAPYQVVLLDANNFHQFQPLLYQVATCGLEPDAIIFPVRKLFEGYANVSFRMAEVIRIDLETRRLHTSQGTLAYDHLILATGSDTNFFGNADLKRHAVGMKNIREALDIRSIILQNLERAAASSDEHERDVCTNIAIVGGGPAGVETAGALAEFKSYILMKDYPDLNMDLMNIYLIQSDAELLNAMSDKASRSALDTLRDMGVDVILNTRVEHYDGLRITTNTGVALEARTLIWTAGVQGESPDGLPPLVYDGGRRIIVDEVNMVKGIEHVYAIGDAACMATEERPRGHPMVAPVAMQQGAHVAENLVRLAVGKEMLPFSYCDKGSLATIGKRRAVADLRRVSLTGFKAWVIWSVVHVLSLVGFRNRFMVFTNWMMSYLTYEKGNRFIVRRYSDASRGLSPTDGQNLSRQRRDDHAAE